MKAISYSLFGYDREKHPSCFDFDCYARGLFANIRFNRILYPNWDNVLNIDEASYDSKYRKLYDWLQGHGYIKVNIFQNGEPLCKAMLRRLQPVFAYTHPEWVYTHVLCRDTDSISTYREAQAVQQWIQENKSIHCITDSISHNIPMMGGMIGIAPAGFTSLMNSRSWTELLSLTTSIDFNQKGADQDFLNKYIYPKCADSSTEHFVLGMKQNIREGNGRHYSIADIEVQGVDPVFKMTNDCAGHIGAAGFYETPTVKFLRHYDPYEAEYLEIEKQFPKLFYWRQ